MWIMIQCSCVCNTGYMSFILGNKATQHLTFEPWVTVFKKSHFWMLVVKNMTDLWSHTVWILVQQHIFFQRQLCNLWISLSGLLTNGKRQSCTTLLYMWSRDGKTQHVLNIRKLWVTNQLKFELHTLNLGKQNCTGNWKLNIIDKIAEYVV